MKMALRLSFLVFVMMTFFTLNSYARFEGLIKSLDEYFTSSSGIVVAVDKENVTIDIGETSGAFVGKIYKVYRDGAEIKHPITGAILGKKRSYVATIKIIDIFDKMSIGSVIDKKDEIHVSDSVVSERPVKVSYEFLNFEKRIEYILNDELSKTNLLITDKNSPIKIVFDQQKDGIIKVDILVNNKTIKNIFFADVNIGDERGKAYGATSDLVRSDLMSYDLKTIAIGYVKKDGKEYIITADKKTVYIFYFDGKGFNKVDEIKGDFSDIQSVETADLNGNGVDEIYISNVYENKEARSYVYEYSEDGKFKQIGKTIPFLIRSIMENGKKKIVVQRVSRGGEYLGGISYLNYAGGEFSRGEAIDNSENLGIYGFGYSDIDGDGKKELIWVDDEFRLRVYKGKQEIYRSVEIFNQTPLYFLMNQEVLLKEQKGYGPADNPVELKSYRKYLKNRIFINEKNELFLLKNTPSYKNLPMLEKFNDSSVGRYVWQAKMIRKSWESDLFEPVIVDYYVVEKYGKYYAYALRNTNPGDKGGLLKSMFNTAKSEIIYIEIK
ncbi:MAG: FG-GAP-like repeat-containing protein [Calditerrivibrio sp.]|uniref:FG-GAP-like repeat-containing protein n=1 Tax=Calditerrivibrio sp. TaxID=2792612 RepID=UPI003D0C22F8